MYALAYPFERYTYKKIYTNFQNNQLKRVLKGKKCE